MAAITFLGWNADVWTFIFAALAAFGSVATAVGVVVALVSYRQAKREEAKASADRSESNELLRKIVVGLARQTESQDLAIRSLQLQQIEPDETSTIEDVEAAEDKVIQLNEDIVNAEARWDAFQLDPSVLDAIAAWKEQIADFVIDIPDFSFVPPDLSAFEELAPQFAEFGRRIAIVRWRDVRDEFRDRTVAQIEALIAKDIDVWQPDLADSERVAWEAFRDSEPNWLMLHPLDVERFQRFVGVCIESGRTEPPGFVALLEDHLSAEELPGVARELSERYREAAERR